MTQDHNPRSTDSSDHDQRFDAWWHNEGSGMPPLSHEEACEHVKRVSRIAWMNGADVAAHSQSPTVKRLPDGTQVIEPANSTLLVPAMQTTDEVDRE